MRFSDFGLREEPKVPSNFSGRPGRNPECARERCKAIAMRVPGNWRNRESKALAHGRRDGRSLIAECRERAGCTAELEHERGIERRSQRGCYAVESVEPDLGLTPEHADVLRGWIQTLTESSWTA